MSRSLKPCFLWPCLALCAGLLLAACGREPAPPAPVNFPSPGARGLEVVRALQGPYGVADVEAGRALFTLCADCHTLEAGGGQAKGPSLRGFALGSRAAARADYSYTEALSESGFVWDLRRLDQWIFNPRETLPGTSMSFIGVRNDKKRRDLIAYLVALSADTPDAPVP